MWTGTAPQYARNGLTMLAAAIDRYLKPAKATDQIRGRLDHEAVAAAAVLDQDPERRRRGRIRAGILRATRLLTAGRRCRASLPAR